jgi:hypothetical protein
MTARAGGGIGILAQISLGVNILQLLAARAIPCDCQ